MLVGEGFRLDGVRGAARLGCNLASVPRLHVAAVVRTRYEMYQRRRTRQRQPGIEARTRPVSSSVR